jgi:3-hydroxyacyl-[acyl-carrier-protein] dehydratase
MRIILISHLYSINANDNEVIEITLADHLHPIFKAHFEGNPLLPAFLQIDILAQILSIDITEIHRSKFMEPIRPLDKIRYALIWDQEASILKVKVSNDVKAVSEFTLGY